MDSNKRITEPYEKVKSGINKTVYSTKRPTTSTLTTEERIRVIANLIVDRLLEVQNNKLIGINMHI